MFINSVPNSKMMETIIGFDSWTEGARYFERLVPEFERRGFKLILIHIGSWGHDKNRPSEELIGQLLVRDISYYGRRSISEILDIEKPRMVLFMSTRALAHIAFNRYAKHKGIPTCHMYHGLVMVQAYGRGESAYKVNYVQHLFLIASRARKNTAIIIPFYIKSLLETNCSFKDWANFLKLTVRRGLGSQDENNPFIDGTSTDIGCVYTSADVDHMHRHYRIPLDKVHVVGNPDLAAFGVKVQDIAFGLSRTDYSDTIIYIDTALTEAGVVFNSINDFISHILLTRDKLKVLGFGFVIKLHPAHYRTSTPSVLVEKGIDLCGSEDFINRIKNSAAVIVEPSSAAMLPALLGVPVLLAQYGKLGEQAYGSVLSSYPRARYLKDLSVVRTLLADERSFLSIDDVKCWTEINLGPMPAEEMAVRAVDAMCNVISENPKSPVR